MVTAGGIREGATIGTAAGVEILQPSRLHHTDRHILGFT
jgi:hypothetical protein